jgi:hypothetical protein
MANELEIIQTTSQEIDRQIATAHAFPRSVEAFHKTALGLVTLDELVAGECIYTLPRADKHIEGASSRFAEIVASAWGNCRYGARVVGETNDFVIAQGVFHDLQTNACVTVDVQRRIIDSKGRRYGVDMIGVTANAACSIAIRNAILRGVPKALWQSLFEAAKRTAAGTETTLGKRRLAAVAAFEERGIKPARLFAALGVQGIDDINLDHLLRLRGYINALNEGEASLTDLFPNPNLYAPAPPQSLDDAKRFPETAPPAEAPGAKANVVKKARGRPRGSRNVPPAFDEAEAVAYLDDLSARLAQAPSNADIDQLAAEFDDQAAPRLDPPRIKHAYELIEAARSMLDEAPLI